MMYQIGYASTDHTTWGTEFPSGPDILFIPNPGERENIDATAYQHVGWVNVDSGAHVRNGKPVSYVIYQSHANAGPDSRPAYIRRRIDGPIRSMETVLVGSRNHDAPTTDKLFTVSTDDLMQEALEFCDTRLDEHKGSISSENAYADCNRANAYIRELIGRLRTAERLKPAAEPRCPKCGVQVDERWDCCEVHEQTEQPMTFYDHAFIAAFTSAPSMTTASAHAIARLLTNHRTPPK